MKFTFSWLKNYLETTASVEQIAEKLSDIGIEVESVEDKAKAYNLFITAKILEANPHPQAEKLKVCKVDNGKETLQVVCGAPNARAGINVVLAQIGATVPANDMKIKASKIREVESQGMLCSRKELALGEDHEGIMELANGVSAGQSFAGYAGLKEVVFDVSLTPNRGDAASVFGIARDLAATGIGRLIAYEAKHLEGSYASPISVSIEDKEGCYEFLGRYIKDVKNTSSPNNIEKCLKAIGSSPKSSLVDISNFLMYDMGRPNHIYDADKIEGDIVVRKSKSGETFIPLGGEEITLEENMLIIADSKKVLAIAGVIGGELSKVDENTKNIFIEVACFNPDSVSLSGRKLNINTDARYRFERRVDHSISKVFMESLSHLIHKSCKGEVSSISEAYGNKPNYITEVKFNFSSINRLAGFDIAKDECINILTKLGFSLEGDKVIIPPHRMGDVVGEADIVEEILRIYGFDKIPSQPLEIDAIQLKRIEGDKNETAVSARLRARALNEAITWSFMDEKIANLFGFDNPIALQNPISSELSVMRPTVLPNLLGLTVKNLARGLNNFGFFEVGSIYAHAYLEQQLSVVSGIRVGSIASKGVHKEERNVDFYDVKADVFTICNTVGFNPDNLQISNDAPSYYHPGRSAAFKLGNKLIALAGELHPKILDSLDIKETTVGFEVFLGNLPPIKVKHAKGMFEYYDFQPVVRDFAFIVDENVFALNLVKSIKGVEQNLIEEVNLFDVYQGKNIEEGKKSIALSVKLQPKEKTFSEEEINEICNKIVNQALIKHGAKLR
jgi:phenylalanyl-tRNA synthetase beta chain